MQGKRLMPLPNITGVNFHTRTDFLQYISFRGYIDKQNRPSVTIFSILILPADEYFYTNKWNSVIIFEDNYDSGSRTQKFVMKVPDLFVENFLHQSHPWSSENS